MKITITPKDAETRKLRSSTGCVIDALAYAAKQWDENEWMLDSIEGSSVSRAVSDKIESDKRREEYQKTKAYKEERAKEEAEARRAKLEARIL